MFQDSFEQLCSPQAVCQRQMTLCCRHVICEVLWPFAVVVELADCPVYLLKELCPLLAILHPHLLLNAESLPVSHTKLAVIKQILTLQQAKEIYLHGTYAKRVHFDNLQHRWSRPDQSSMHTCSCLQRAIACQWSAGLCWI